MAPATAGVVTGMAGEVSLPTLSVVMSCRNAAETLQATLEALARQRYPGWWEVVLVDNGSTDDTYDVLHRYADRFPRCSVIRAPEPGYQPRAINLGIGRSSGEAIVFLDSDDEVAGDYLLHMGRALATASLVGAAVDITRLNAPEVQKRRRPLQATRIDTFSGYLPAVVGAAMGARREAMELVGGWDASLPSPARPGRLVAPAPGRGRGGVRPGRGAGPSLPGRHRRDVRAGGRLRGGRGGPLPTPPPVRHATAFDPADGRGIVRTRVGGAHGSRPGGLARLATRAGMLSWGRLQRQCPLPHALSLGAQTRHRGLGQAISLTIERTEAPAWKKKFEFPPRRARESTSA